MPDQQRIKELEAQYKRHSEAELLAIMHERHPTDEQHIAAMVTLRGLDKESQAKAIALSEAQHQASMSIGNRTLKWTIAATIAAILAVLLTALSVWQTAKGVSASPASLPQSSAPRIESKSVPSIATPSTRP